MKVQTYLADTMINSLLGGQHSLLDSYSARCTYPQVHDYHEIALTIKGSMDITVGNKKFSVKSGDLIWIRPGEIHSKSSFRECTQLNLSFSQDTVDALIEYFNDDVITKLLSSSELMPVLPLSVSQQAEIRQRLDKLNMLSTRDLSLARVQMRIILSHVLGLFAQHVWESAELHKDDDPPMWFTFLLWELGKPEKLYSSLDDLAIMSQRSKAYISRSFRKYVGMTPTNYINKLRIEHAESLLIHSDKPIVEVAMESGFDNLSHFYHLFSKKNGMSPLAYRKNNLVLPD